MCKGSVVFYISFVESDNPVKNDDDILDIASSRIAALAVISSSDGNFVYICIYSI